MLQYKDIGHSLKDVFAGTSVHYDDTRSSAIAEGPHDAHLMLTTQLLHNAHVYEYWQTLICENRH